MYKCKVLYNFCLADYLNKFKIVVGLLHECQISGVVFKGCLKHLRTKELHVIVAFNSVYLPQQDLRLVPLSLVSQILILVSVDFVRAEVKIHKFLLRFLLTGGDIPSGEGVSFVKSDELILYLLCGDVHASFEHTHEVYHVSVEAGDNLNPLEVRHVSKPLVVSAEVKDSVNPNHCFL